MSEWRTGTLEEVAAPIERPFAMGPFGSRIKKENYRDSGVPVIRGGNLQGVRFDDAGYVFLGEEKAKELSASTAGPGDVVFVAQGGIGQVGLVPSDGSFDRFILSQNLMKVTVDPAKADPAFVFYYFRSRLGQHEILSYANPTGVPCISRPLTSLKSFRLPVPPVDVQRCIAHILGTLDDKIELNRRMNRTLEAIARTIYKSWFVDFDPVHAKAEGREPVGMDPETAALFPDSFQDSPLGKIPKGWEVVGIEHFSQLASGKRPISLRDTETDEADIPVYGGSGIMGYTTEALETRGTIVTGRVGTLGQIYVLDVDAWPSDNTIVVRPKTAAATTYLCRCMERMDLAGLNSGSTQPLLTQRALKSLGLLDPGKELLDRFYRCVSPLRALQTSASRQCVSLARERDCLLPKLMSGELPEEVVP